MLALHLLYQKKFHLSTSYMTQFYFRVSALKSPPCSTLKRGLLQYIYASRKKNLQKSFSYHFVPIILPIKFYRFRNFQSTSFVSWTQARCLRYILSIVLFCLIIQVIDLGYIFKIRDFVCKQAACITF